jgi:8-oxo-dGTP pyrophosphatase MutT (NUDIX family)
MLESHQEALIAALSNYRGADEREESDRNRILEHVKSTPMWWHRDTLPGHVTASGFVTDSSLQFLLLHHHRKLDRWLQLGGHDEGERSPMTAVLREVREESGLAAFQFYRGPVIFDLDIHAIPASSKMAAHDHLDVRFLLVADPSAPLVRAQEESKKLEWVPLQEAGERMNEHGGWRVIEKIRACAQPTG